MDQQKIQRDFEDILKGKSWWRRFVGSQFVEGVALFVGQIVFMVKQAADKALGEAFLSTAIKRASVLASAEDRGYVGRRVTPSIGDALIKNKTENVIHLPIHTHMISRNQLVYLIQEPVTIEPNDSQMVKLVQLELVKVTKKVVNQDLFMAVLLPKDLTAQASSIDVYIEYAGNRERWSKSFMFRNSNSGSKVYTEFYKPTEQIGIRFGDGINGSIPPLGSTIILEVWCTEGESMLVEGQKLTLIGDVSDLDEKVEISTVTPITGGAPAENTEETRLGALYSTAYDEQIVWGGDYIHFIRTHIGGITWLRVWGESEEEKSTGVKSLDNINSIFISGHKKGVNQDSLQKNIIELLGNIPNQMNKHFKYRDTNYLPFTIKINGKCATHLVPEDVKVKLINALDTRFGKDSKDIQDGILLKDIWAFIDSTHLLIDYNLEVVGVMQSVKLNDFIFMDVVKSSIQVDYKWKSIG